MKKEKLSDALTWDDLADEYFKETGQYARTKPMSSVLYWAEQQKDKFYFSSKGKMYKIIKD